MQNLQKKLQIIVRFFSDLTFFPLQFIFDKIRRIILQLNLIILSIFDTIIHFQNIWNEILPGRYLLKINNL